MKRLIDYPKEKTALQVIAKDLRSISNSDYIQYVETVIGLRGINQRIAEIIKSLENNPRADAPEITNTK